MRSRAAARRGRVADDDEVLLGFRLMRAASWFNDGMRAPDDGLSGLDCSMVAGATSLVVDIVDVEDDVVNARLVTRALYGRQAAGNPKMELIQVHLEIGPPLLDFIQRYSLSHFMSVLHAKYRAAYPACIKALYFFVT